MEAPQLPPQVCPLDVLHTHLQAPSSKGNAVSDPTCCNVFIQHSSPYSSTLSCCYTCKRYLADRTPIIQISALLLRIASESFRLAALTRPSIHHDNIASQPHPSRENQSLTDQIHLEPPIMMKENSIRSSHHLPKGAQFQRFSTSLLHPFSPSTSSSPHPRIRGARTVTNFGWRLGTVRGTVAIRFARNLPQFLLPSR